MITIVRTDSDNIDFIHLVKQLDADLALRDGADHAFYAQFNKTNHLRQAIVAYDDDGVPVACGAIREYQPATMEVKRMFTIPEKRGLGIASTVLAALETWAREMSYTKCVLETGKRQPEAIAAYTKNGYHIISNYGQYIGMEATSICMKKELI